MSSEQLIAAFEDIVRAIDLIDTWVKEAGGPDLALRADTQSRSAVERQLLKQEDVLAALTFRLG